MDLQQRTKHFCAYVILCACLLRLLSSGLPGWIWEQMHQINSERFLKYTETGRNVRFSSSPEKTLDHSRESPAPWIPLPERPVFGKEDVKMVQLYNTCGLQPDLEALIEQPLTWDLTEKAPSVLILHTHTTESYTKSEENYVETTRYRTLDEGFNMLSVGAVVAAILEENGIGVIHDRQIHDYPSYNGSYVHARESTSRILEENPSISLVLDLHRDASENADGQLQTSAVVDGMRAAQLMLVVGTNVSRQSHKNWEENLAVALKLQIQLERRNPGIMRPLNLRSQRFNQDLCPGALLVEVGAAGNTRKEALLAAKVLAEGILALTGGTDADRQ